MNLEDLTKIAEAYLGCDRDAGIHSDIEFYENPKGLILFRYIHNIWQGYCKEEEWKTVFSDLKEYKGIMTKQEIINHPGWPMQCEEQAVKERDCKMNLTEIAETKLRKFEAFKGPARSQTKYFECNCCNQIYYRNIWTLDKTGECLLDSGYEPEIKITKEKLA